MDRQRDQGRDDLGVGVRGPNPRDFYPTIAFAVSLVVAFVVFEWYGRRFWFFGDEWAFLTRDRLVTGNADAFVRALVRPHNEHWSTLPRLWYWLAEDVFGLRSYTPYLTAVVVLHLIVAVLLWVLLRRLGINAWIAAGAGAMMALFGPGAENIFWGFQVGFVGSALFGIAAILLADHTGGQRGRDVGAVACGLAALLCSGIGVPFVVALGVSVLFRRGWRPAIAVVLPLAVVFLAWYVAFGRANEANTVPRAGPSQWLPYIFVQATNALESITQIPMIGGVILVFVLIWVGCNVRTDFLVHSKRAPVYGLLAGGVLLSLTTALGRASLGVDQARSSRYVYLLAVVLIPVLALMLDSLLRRDRRAAVPIAIFVSIAVVGSFTAIPRYAFSQGLVVTGQKNQIMAAASDELMVQFAPDWYVPAPELSFGLSMQQVRAWQIAGELPAWVADPANRDAVRAAALVGVSVVDAAGPIDGARIRGTSVARSNTTEGCLSLVAREPDATVRVAIGTVGGAVVSVGSGDVGGARVDFDQDRKHPVPIVVPGGQSVLVTAAAPAELVLRLVRTGAAVTICGPT